MSLQSSVRGFNLESYQIIFSSASISLASPGLTNLVSVSESGELSVIGLNVSVGATGTPTVTLEVQIDGQTTQTLALYSGANSFASAVRPFVTHWADTGAPGDGVTFVQIPIHCRYQTSCRVGVNISGAASGGTLIATVTRGKKIV